jgi:hypothetical protein
LTTIKEVLLTCFARLRKWKKWNNEIQCQEPKMKQWNPVSWTKDETMKSSVKNQKWNNEIQCQEPKMKQWNPVSRPKNETMKSSVKN